MASTPPTPIPNQPVPVVRTSQFRLNRKAIASALFNVGLVVTLLQQNAPTLKALFPNWQGLPLFITTLGGLWSMVEKFVDAQHMGVANYTPPTAAAPALLLTSTQEVAAVPPIPAAQQTPPTPSNR